MRAFVWLGIIMLGCACSAPAQETCNETKLGGAANAVTAIRHSLQGQSVRADDPAIPPPLRAQLKQLKANLADAADAAFSCADSSATPDALQGSLRGALHVTEPSPEAVDDSRGKRDYGTYGADLAVQVFQLFGRPKLFEVDFRWSVECGDDHLLLVFESGGDHAPHSWRERLRWAAPETASSADSFGDFILLTPLTGSPTAPNWRFLVAHGHPACAAVPRPSHFDLDLLAPTADPARPRVDWHFTHPYTQDYVEPSLSTTEDTIDLRIVHRPVPGGAAAAVPPPDVFRFHLTPSGKVEPSPDSPGEGSGATAVTPASSSSPR